MKLFIVLFIFCDCLAIKKIECGGDNVESTPDKIKFRLPTNKDLLFEHGHREYSQLMERQTMPIYGRCWSGAVVKLKASCEQLDEYRQSWLAMAFTYCFLETAGNVDVLGKGCQELTRHKNYEQTTQSEITECTRSIDMSIFQTYSLFFVHTQSICFYLQAKSWQRNTELLVDHLVVNTHSVSNRLNKALESSRNLEVMQNMSLKAQKELNEQVVEAKVSWTNFELQTREQRAIIERVLEQFVLLRRFLLVEMSVNSTIVFYLFAMAAIYFATTPKRTSNARLVLYLLLAASYAVEHKVIDFVTSSEAAPLSVMNFVWGVRKVFASLMTIVYIWWMATYEDAATLTAARLKETSERLEAIDSKLARLEENSERWTSWFSENEDEVDTGATSYTTMFIDSDFESGTDSRQPPKIAHKIKKSHMTNSPVYNLRSNRSITPVRKEIQNKATVRTRSPTKKKKRLVSLYSSDED